ncbi:MAG TPA: DUF1345 domain-containing protein [Actinomycetota bacterium]
MAFVIATVAGAIVALLLWLGVESIDRVDTVVVLFLAAWNLFAILYVVFTLRTFLPVPRAEFEAMMSERGASRATFWRLLNREGEGPTYAVESALVAFSVVILLPRIPVLETDWVLVPTSFIILMSCWALSIVSYALHYAEKDFVETGLEFPGTRTNDFHDYLYFSIAVATTFGATDVNITTPTMRRVVNFHTVLTFVYNSVIVATLAAILVN